MSSDGQNETRQPDATVTAEANRVAGNEDPPEGFWSAYVGRAISDGLRSAALFQLYALIGGCFLCAFFVGTALFRVRLSTFARLMLVAPAPLYFPALTVINSLIFTILVTCRRNLGRIEDALALVADGLTAPVLRVLPARTISLDELRARLLDSSKHLKKAEASKTPSAPSESATGKSASIASRALLNLAIRTVLYAIEKRYRAALVFGRNNLSAATVKRMLSGELVSFLLAPFTSALTLYTALTIFETLFLAIAPFLIMYALAKPSPDAFFESSRFS